MRHPPETCALIKLEVPSLKAEEEKNNNACCYHKILKILAIAMRHPSGNMCADRMRKSSALRPKKKKNNNARCHHEILGIPTNRYAPPSWKHGC